VGEFYEISTLRRFFARRVPHRFFSPNPARVGYLVFAYLVIFGHFLLTVQVLSGALPWTLWIPSFFIAFNVGTFGFFYLHEALHGAVFRSPFLTHFTAFLGGIPFLCTPHLWFHWHRHHHRYTATNSDPDRARHPEMDKPSSWQTKLHDFGKQLLYQDPVSLIIPFFVISGHHLLMFMECLFKISEFKINRLRASGEFFLLIALFLTPFFIFPLQLSFLGIYFPLLISNLICNLYILSNHNARPLNDKNYPLQNSTSVYLIKGLGWTHMDFGRHVEHHIFPHVTHKKLRKISGSLEKQYGTEFEQQSLFATL